MTADPLISVITPTYDRHCQLIERCLPSVCAQTYGNLEHLVVSDGPDPELRKRLSEFHLHQPHLKFFEMDKHGGHWGHEARLFALSRARGEWVAWLDDDDAYRPDHIKELYEACAAAKAMWGYSRMLIGADTRWSNQFRDNPDVCSGDPVYDPARGEVLTSMIFSRREAFFTATWGTGTFHPDGDLVRAWHEAGLPYVSLPKVTVDMFIYRTTCGGHRDQA